MAMFVIIIAVTGETFSRIMSQSSLQSKLAASNIEGIVSLEMMRKDLGSAGFGLPWAFDAPITYKEVKPGDADSRETIAAAYNATPDTEIQTLIPLAVSGGNNVELGDATKLIEGSDYLVIRSTSVGASLAAQRWSFMNYTGMSKPATLTPQSWTQDNLAADDWVVVVKVGLINSFSKELVTNSDAFTTQYTAENLNYYAPDQSKVTNYVYGVSSTEEPRMPFNRADYYVRIPAGTEGNRLPKRCAPNTGILYKALVKHSDGTVSGASEFPLLDCVADMQVVYILDSSSNGQTTETDSLAGLSAQEIRDQLKSIQVYILSHEGGKDSFYTYPNEKIAVGPSPDGVITGAGRSFDLKETIDTGWERYRWKVYRFSVNPANLASTL
jgi:hypothetical protein